MESKLITVAARRVTVSQEGYARRASGEDVSCYTVAPAKSKAPIPNKGRVVYLGDYRTEATHGQEESRCSLPSQVCPPGGQERGVGWRLGLVMECVATAAIVAMAVGTLLCFFTL